MTVSVGNGKTYALPSTAEGVRVLNEAMEIFAATALGNRDYGDVLTITKGGDIRSGDPFVHVCINCQTYQNAIPASLPAGQTLTFTDIDVKIAATGFYLNGTDATSVFTLKRCNMFSGTGWTGYNCTANFIQCIVKPVNRGNGIFGGGPTSIINAYHCAFISCNYGFGSNTYGATATVFSKNCLYYDCVTDIYNGNGPITGTNNATSKNTTLNAIWTMNNQTKDTYKFKYYYSPTGATKYPDDWRVDPASSVIGQGVDAGLGLTVDCDNQPIPDTAHPAIGPSQGVNFGLTSSDPGESNVIREADGGPASYIINGVTKTPSFNLSAAKTAYENGRNGPAPDPAKIINTQAAFKVLGDTITPSFDLAADRMEQYNAGYDAGYDAGEAYATGQFPSWETARNTEIDVEDVAATVDVFQFGEHRTGTLPSESPNAPALSVGEVSGLTAPVDVTGDVGATHHLLLIRRKTGEVIDTQTRLGDGSVTLTADVAPATYDILAWSSAGGLVSESVLISGDDAISISGNPSNPPGFANVLAQRIVNALNIHEGDGYFSMDFTAVRSYRPAYKLEDMGTLHVTVVAKATEESLASRAQVSNACQIDIGIQKKLAPASSDADDNAALDDLMGLVQEIKDFIRAVKVFGEGRWIATESSPIYSPEHLRDLRQFTSVLTVTLKVIE